MIVRQPLVRMKGIKPTKQRKTNESKSTLNQYISKIDLRLFSFV